MNVPEVYPKVEFPVSRGTQMISPNIKWDHSEDFFVIDYKDNMEEYSAERKVKISLTDSDFEFVAGHLIDGKSSDKR